jgi:hypothetical protein
VTATLTVLALSVAVAAALRSTWSPCGLSMLSTITPFGERSKGHRFGATAAWFILGATAGGLALGAVAAGAAGLVEAGAPTDTTVGMVALIATLVVGVSDSGRAGTRIPVHYRQVNERWLDTYRPWVYGVGFGFQIGCGLATYITTAAVYLVVVLAASTADPVVALAVCAAFGLVRGLAVLLTHRIRTPTELPAFHRRFADLRPWADRAMSVTVAVSAGVLALAVGPVPAGYAVLGVVAGAGGVRLVTRRVHRPDRVTAAPSPAVEGMGPDGRTRASAEAADRSVALG